MGTLRFVSIAFAMFVVAFFGVRWLFAVQPLKPDARVPTFHQVDVNSPRYQMEQSFASDNDATRDQLRQAVLETVKAFGDEPCNDALKASYVKAATAYARAWLSIAPCVAKRNCGSSDGPKLDRAQKAFGSPLDHRVREAMHRLHEAGILATADFPKDAVVMVAQFAGDPNINPLADARFKAVNAELRGSGRDPSSCRAISIP
jgi:hypothetical protein